jgi:hypothetical protein
VVCGRTYRFWAMTCLTNVTPDDLPLDTQKMLRALG